MTEERARRSLGRRIGRTLALLLVVLAALTAGLRVLGVAEGLFFHPRRGATPIPARFAGGEVVTFRSVDGTRLRGWFLPARPTAPEAGATPAVLFLHGNAGHLLTHVAFFEFLPAAGFHVLAVDYRGYGESEGSARRREGLLADAHAALDALLARDGVDPGRVGVYGHSLGGALALNLAADRPEVRALVTVAAFADWRDVGASVLGGDPPPLPARAVAWALLPNHRRPEDAARRLDRPLLVLHGDADAVVPFSHGERIAEAAPDATFVPLPGASHNTWRSTHPEAERRIATFLRRHLAGAQLR